MVHEHSVSAVHAFFTAVVRGGFTRKVVVREQFILYFLVGISLPEIFQISKPDLGEQVPFKGEQRIRMRQYVRELGQKIDDLEISPEWYGEFQRIIALHYPQPASYRDIKAARNVLFFTRRLRAVQGK